MTRVEDFSVYWSETEFETGEVISAKLSPGDATGAHLTGALGQDILKICYREISQLASVIVTFAY